MDPRVSPLLRLGILLNSDWPPGPDQPRYLSPMITVDHPYSGQPEEENQLILYLFTVTAAMQKQCFQNVLSYDLSSVERLREIRPNTKTRGQWWGVSCLFLLSLWHWVRPWGVTSAVWGTSAGSGLCLMKYFLGLRVPGLMECGDSSSSVTS